MSPPALDHIVKKCLGKDPEDRWQNAADLASELNWIREGGSQAGVPLPVVSVRRSRERLGELLELRRQHGAIECLVPLAGPGDPLGPRRIEKVGVAVDDFERRFFLGCGGAPCRPCRRDSPNAADEEVSPPHGNSPVFSAIA